MVNGAAPDGGDARRAERALAIGYAPAAAQAGLTALLALDGALGGILRSTREPLATQLRLAWWREALAGLDRGEGVVDPVLVATARDVLPHRVTGAALAGTVDGWEALLAERIGDEALATHAHARGGGLFAAAAAVLGGHDDRVQAAGEGWALADLAAKLSDPVLAAQARASAGERLATALAGTWPARLRSLGALAWLARMDLDAGARPAGHPLRVARLLRFRLLGR